MLPSAGMGGFKIAFPVQCFDILKMTSVGMTLRNKAILMSDQHPILSILSQDFYLRPLDVRHARRQPMMFHGGLIPARHSDSCEDFAYVPGNSVTQKVWSVLVGANWRLS
jgi:hypothetical protein